MNVHAQRERLATPDPLGEFRLLEKKLITTVPRDSLAQTTHDSVYVYAIKFSTVGREFNGFYILPTRGLELPGILFNVKEDVKPLGFNSGDGIRLMSNVLPGHAIIIFHNYDQYTSHTLSSNSCNEMSVATNLIDHLHLFPEIDSRRVTLKDVPTWPD